MVYRELEIGIYSDILEEIQVSYFYFKNMA